MSLTKYLVESAICLQMDAENSTEVIRQLGQRLIDAGLVKESFIDAALTRESALPTGLPLGGEINAAIPHTDIEHVIHSGVALATLNKPVVFQNMVSPDEAVEVRIVFLLALEEPHAQIEMLQEVAGVLQDSQLLQQLLAATDTKEVMSAFSQAEKQAGIH
jgi:PTS system galactitol-specific IIA component